MKAFDSTALRSFLAKDLLASFVVFLVALPLCMGIAIASGLPPATGLITGMVGGLVVGFISGSPLQVSGPAAGLAVVVAELVHEYGIELLGPVLILAGALQWLAGVLKLGQLFRAMSPAVIYGMLAGIGILILLSQLHVMTDNKPFTHGVENLLAIPAAFQDVLLLTDGGSHAIATAIGVVTIAILLLWERFRPHKLRLLPGALIAVLVCTIAAAVFQFRIQYVDVPANLMQVIQLPQLSTLPRLFHAPLLLEAIAIAFIASAESLLSAVAVDRLHHGSRTNFDQELAAQGIGNMVCGVLGALPMTGVIVRSSVNVEAGARTRLSAILHGVWLLALIVAAPGLLRLVPTASLAAILVYTGYKLIEVEHIRQLKQYGRFPLFIFFATLAGIVLMDLLAGVLIGILLTAVAIVQKLSRLTISTTQDQQNHRVDLYLEGAATFLRLPQLAATLENIPPGTELHVHLDRLAYIDHSCLDLFSTWAKQQEEVGSSLIVQWDGLVDRFRRPFTAQSSRLVA
jgi:MFS superfamily sulfate permease-like transporter